MALTKTLLNKTLEFLSNLRVERYSFVKTGTTSAAAGAGAGTTPTVTLAAGSNDHKGRVTVLTGTTALADVLFTLTFGTVFNAAPKVFIKAANAAAAALSGTTQPYVSSELVGSFAIRPASAALADATTYIFDYVVEGQQDLVVATKWLALVEKVDCPGVPTVSGRTVTIALPPWITKGFVTLFGRK